MDFSKITTTVIAILLTSLTAFSVYLVQEIQAIKVANSANERYILQLEYHTRTLADHENRIREIEHQMSNVK